MANMNIKTEKILSMSNIRRIIMLGISLKDSISKLEDKCIEDYDATKTYVKNALVIYNGYIYKTKTVTTGDFDENKFEKIGDNLDLLTLDDIKALINLSDEEIASLQSLISTEIRLDKCFSSSDTYNRLLTVENNCKTFTMEQLAKKMGASYKVVTTTDEVTSTEFLYLISNSTAYDIYALIEGVVTKIGDTTIDLSNYYTKNEIDSDFLKKTDADGKYITQTSFNSHTSDTDIHTSATEKASYVKKTDITTNIDETSTDDTVPTNKAVYDNAIKDKNIKTYTSLEQLGLTKGSETLQDIANSMVDGSIAIIPVIDGVNQSLYPTRHGNLVTYRGNNNRIDFMFYPTTDHVVSNNNGLVYVCSYHGTQDLLFGWQRICTTSVNNISKTKIELDSKIFSNGDVYYEVKNGVCYVSILNLTPTKAGVSLLVSDSMPKTNYYILQTLSLGNTDALPTTPITARILEGSTELVIHSNNNANALYGSFSYPVAES